MGLTSATERTPFVDLAAQRSALQDALERACAETLARGDYILGAEVAWLEEEFASYCGAAHAVGVDSGTSALELALRAHGIGVGDEVITAANTFVATAFAISHSGATPVLVDADPDTYTIDVRQFARAITNRTKAIIPVHLYGQPADMAAVRAVADEHGLSVIEDACQAHGASEGPHRAGTLGDAAAFSFYPAKNLGAHGDGGIIVTNDAAIADRLRLLRNYGAVQKYRSDVIGFNRRLDTLQAAILRVKLPHLDRWNAARRARAALYDALLAPLPVTRPLCREGVEHVWHLYVIRVADRDRVRTQLADRGIETGIHYPVPIHLQPAYRFLGHRRGDFPVAERHADHVLSLPMYPELPDAHIVRVTEALSEAVGI